MCLCVVVVLVMRISLCSHSGYHVHSFVLTNGLVVTNCVQVKFYLSQLADRNAEVKDTACLCISELSQKVS